MSRRIGALVLACLPFVVVAATNAPNTDVVIFGNAASEAGHGLTTGFTTVWATVAPIPSEPSLTGASDVVTGALGQSARRLLPRTPNGDYYGGEARFTLAVDPVKENNFTLKMWGGDLASQSWLVLEVEGLEVGGRHLVRDESILQNFNGGLPGRFLYRTVRLPKNMTAGKTSVSVRLRSIGWISYYGSPYDNYQKRMAAPTVGLYRAYMHTGAQPDITGEAQGATPAMTQASTAAADEAAWLAQWKAQVTSTLNARLSAAPSSLTADDMDYLAQAYSVSWTPAYANAAVPSKVMAAMDAMVTAYSAAPTTYLGQKFADHGGNGGWGGYLGQAGRAIQALWTQIGGQLDVTVDYGGTLGVTTRRAAWAIALRASVDIGRTNRRTIGNQTIDAALRTYWANAALLLVSPSQALLETEARRYLYEAFGLSPWMGNDVAGTGPVPIKGPAPYGPNWYMVTSRGTSKEDCLVGGDYGEVGPQAFLLGRELGDAQLTQQGIKMLRARAGLRYPAADSAGNLMSTAVEPIGCRNDHKFNDHTVYLARGSETVLVAASGAATIGTDLLGYAQQQLNEGQLLGEMPATGSGWQKGYAGWNRVVAVPGAYQAFRAQAPTGVTLPMSIGKPDYGWADEENMAVAARRGEERFFANMYWRGPAGINALAKVFVTTPTTGFVGEVTIDEVLYRPSGAVVTFNKSVDNTPNYGYPPPDGPINANVGLQLPVALRPDLTAIPATNRDAGRGTAYTFRYGNWLVVMNAHASATYMPTMPASFGSGKDLISGLTKYWPLILAPKTSAVFYMPDVKAPPGPRDTFKLTASHSGRVLSTSRDAATDKSTAKQKTYQAEANQKWRLEPGANDDYRVRVEASGLVLEALSSNLGSNSVVMVRPDRTDNLQLWRVTSLGGSNYRICAKVNTKYCLTVLNASTAADAPVVLNTFLGAPHQVWSLSAP